MQAALDHAPARTKGLAFTPQFCAPGADPYAAHRWGLRDSAVKDMRTGRAVWSQAGCEFPDHFSDQAVRIVASKYFYGDAGKGDDPADGGREHSLRQVVSRITDTIAGWGHAGGYFATEEAARTFGNELAAIQIGQHGCFNSPVLFNIGVWHKYGVPGTTRAWRWDEEAGATVAVAAGESYKHPQVSACFIIGVDDDMESIMLRGVAEGMLFKYGSGAGSDNSTLRSTRERINGGGRPSGPVSFMRIYDAIGGVVKSGGKCLAPHQPVFTAGGVKTARDLAESGRDFTVLSYSKRQGRVTAKTARAWKSGEKPVVAVITDKGEFHVSADHPFLLKTGEVVRAIDLKAGRSLLAVTTQRHSADYVTVGLLDGSGGETQLHRLVAHDLMGCPWSHGVVHHGPRGKLDSEPDNLTVLPSQSEHATIHAIEQVAAGTHIFQNRTFPKAGDTNGMHASSSFWADEARADAYRAKQGQILVSSGRAAGMQSVAVRAKMLNVGYRMINAGYDISTFERYYEARKRAIGKIGNSKEQLLAKFRAQFGGYAAYYDELRRGNHKVVEVRPVGTMAVYSVEVDDPEDDDKRPLTEHNYVLAPIGATEPYINGVVCANSRRAAKMETLKVHHPDIMEFIDCKPASERMAHALIDAGWSGDMHGEVYGSLPFQNSNLSVRATDLFMRKAVGIDLDTAWQTIAVTTGTPTSTDGTLMPTYRAPEVLDRIAANTWFCGDPGMQFHDTIQHWHTTPEAGEIASSNPCSEFIYLNDTACNLASINLIKFLLPDGRFDVDVFRAAVRTVFVAQEIMVDNASYPTEAIAANSHRFRPLGLGYSNLGGLLMALGLPYDSPEGRALAGAITAIMTAEAYLASAEMAEAKGACDGFAASRDSMLRVMDQHRDAAGGLDADLLQDAVRNGSVLKKVACHLWRHVVERGKAVGFRNMQATLLAPTGTIAFFMDCDTTGVEPETALIRYKELAGGGSMTIANGLVPAALRSLLFDETDIDEAVEYVASHGTIEGFVPSIHGELTDEQLAVFDCALPTKAGGRTIAVGGHIGMMAAVQPFLSGAISKTVNVPEEATPEEIRAAYVLGWRSGLKALAIYRDNSKRSQPLSARKADDVDKAASPAPAPAPAPAPVLAASPSPVRVRLPDTRHGITHKFTVGDVEAYMNVGLYPDGRPGELFLKIAKEGSTVSGLVDSWATMVSIALQYGVPVQTIVEKFRGGRFEPAGSTHNRDIPFASSLIDYVAQWLGREFPPGAARAESVTTVVPGGTTVTDVVPYVNGSIDTARIVAHAPTCEHCGGLTRPSGRCWVCVSCGTTTGGCS